jgi:ABC-type uncharacterized transport system fused permease/ATPase subunit
VASPAEQRPTGTLRDNVVYPTDAPATPDESVDERVSDVLRVVNLEHILQRFSIGDRVDYSSLLSPGEQQRLAFARVLFHEPRFLILDESTSALDSELEQRMLSLVVASGAGIISVAHRPTAYPYHEYMLTLHRHDGAGAPAPPLLEQVADFMRARPDLFPECVAAVCLRVVLPGGMGVS